MEPDTWVKLLYTYGPFALLVFFFAVGETRARSALKDPAVTNKKVAVSIYVANWLAIFVLLGFAISAWYKLSFNTEFAIKGRLANLQGTENVASTSELYLRRVYGPGGRFDYQWRLVTPKQLDEGDKVSFVLDLSTPGSEKLRNYEFTVHPDYYRSDVAISYDRQQDRLFLHSGSHSEQLQPLTEAASQATRPRRSLFAWTVEAQSMAQQVPLQDRLAASDPIIRRQARKDLAVQQESQWKFIDNSLANKSGTYQLKLGIIVALNANGCANLGKLSPPALTEVITASSDPDPELRNQARRCLVKQANPMIDAGLDKAIHEARNSPESAAELARTQLEVLYTLGVQAKDRYGSRQAQDRGEIDRAIGYFRKAWGSRALVAPEGRVLFAKALYGWGLALHDRSWIERDGTHKRIPALVRAAQDKFTEFLSEVRAAKNPQAYPYAEHLRRAEAYLKNPQPESLQLN